MATFFNIEAFIKIFALRNYYFESNWNRFDFFIVIAGDISVMIEINISDVKKY